jgi:hypothetical protein
MFGMEVTRFAASTVEGFIQQLAVSCVARGYVFYVCGHLPGHKDPRELDRKMAERYHLALSKWSRARRKRAGLANVRYLRFDRFFVLVATPGEHRFFADEAGLIQDCRRVPIKFGGYSVSSRGGRAHVRIEREQYNLLKAYFLEVALRRRADALERMVASLPFEPYAPVRRQLLNLVRAINAERKAAGYEPLRYDCIRMKRRIVKPFARAGSGGDDEREDQIREPSRLEEHGPLPQRRAVRMLPERQ